MLKIIVVTILIIAATVAFTKLNNVAKQLNANRIAAQTVINQIN